MPSADYTKERERYRLRQRQRHAARLASGVCTRCGATPPVPGRLKCEPCLQRQRDSDRVRRDRAKTEGKQYGGRDPERSRRADRAGDRRRRRARRDAGFCTSCGHRRPAQGRSVCGPCREAQREVERARYHARRAAGRCVRCRQPAFSGSSRCGRCATLEAARVSSERKSATARRRYIGRRVRGECVDCGVDTAGAARCPRCAWRSNARAPDKHGLLLSPSYTVIELANGADHGTYEAEAEVLACLVFAGLRIDQVDIRSNVPLMGIGGG